MNVIRNSELTSRETIIVGVSLAVGIGFSMVFPFWASSLLSGVPGTALTAIILSLLLKEDKMDDNTQKGDEEE